MPLASTLKTWGFPLMLASGSGLLLYLASPGTGGSGLLVWIALVPLLLAIHQVDWRRAPLLGLLTGLCYHLPLLHWITVVLGEHGDVALPVAILALLLLALYMSLYPAIFVLLLLAGSKPASGDGHPPRRLPPPADWLKVIWLAPLLWVMLDGLRAWLFTGFPWQDLAYDLYQYPLLLQAADLAGHYGITFVIVLVNALLAALLQRLLTRKLGSEPNFRHPNFRQRLLTRKSGSRNLGSELNCRPTVATIGGLLIALLLPAALVVYGTYKLPRLEPAAAAPRLATAIIQGNIPQQDKWDYEWQTATVERYLALSRQALQETDARLLIWPETALPFYPLENPLLDRLIDFSNRHDCYLLTGAPHREPTADATYRYHNSALLIAPAAAGEKQRPVDQPPWQRPEQQLSLYHKQHLVPFGEYIPLRWLLPYFAPIVETMGDFSPGPGPQLLTAADQRLGVLICYEAIFPRLAREMTDNGAELLINITNDAWFGATNAPWQHLSMAVLRAVENRRPLARAANTGISAFILPDGQIKQATDLFTADWRYLELPLSPRLKQQTVFSAGGHLLPLVCLLLFSVGTIRHFCVKLLHNKRL
ncbi:MAG: apolipoprotein N-acyltransferase [Desulfurivibrio sp.]|nr:apolipoprotein N-acyltransferase [Desulfurivibrio sp.]